MAKRKRVRSKSKRRANGSGRKRYETRVVDGTPKCFDTRTGREVSFGHCMTFDFDGDTDVVLKPDRCNCKVPVSVLKAVRDKVVSKKNTRWALSAGADE